MRLRREPRASRPESAALVQHLTLIIGMVGGAIAAGENRFLPLSTLGGLVKGRSRTVLGIVSGGIAAGVSAVLIAAGVDFVRAEQGSGQVLAYGIPVWVVQAVIPAGFGLITLRLLGHSVKSWAGRGIAAMLAGTWILLWSFSPIWALAALAAATPAGVPAFVILGGVALI